MLAIKAGKNNRTPVFVDLDALRREEGQDRIKYLKEEADRGQLQRKVARRVEAAKSVGRAGRGVRPIVDERGSPEARSVAAGTPILQPTDERRRTGSHYTPRSLTEPIVRHALEPAFERLGPDAHAGADARPQGAAIRPWAPAPSWSRPAASSATRLVAGLGALAGQAADHPARRGRGAARPPARRAALPLRRRPQPDGGRSRAPVALARDAGARSRVHLPRSRAEDGRQPRRADARPDRGGALGRRQARPAAVRGDLRGRDRRGAGGPRGDPRRTGRRAPRDPGGRYRGVEERSSACASSATRSSPRSFRRRKPRRERSAQKDRELVRRAAATAGTSSASRGERCGREASARGRSTGRSSFRRSSSARIRGFDAIVGNPPFAGKNTHLQSATGRLSRLAPELCTKMPRQLPTSWPTSSAARSTCSARADLRPYRDEHDRPGRHASERPRCDLHARRHDLRLRAAP